MGLLWPAESGGLAVASIHAGPAQFDWLNVASHDDVRVKMLSDNNSGPRADWPGVMSMLSELGAAGWHWSLSAEIEVEPPTGWLTIVPQAIRIDDRTGHPQVDDELVMMIEDRLGIEHMTRLDKENHDSWHWGT